MLLREHVARGRVLPERAHVQRAVANVAAFHRVHAFLGADVVRVKHAEIPHLPVVRRATRGVGPQHEASVEEDFVAVILHDQITRERRLEAAQPRHDRVGKKLLRRGFQRPGRHRALGLNLPTRHAPESAELLNLKTPPLEPLAVSVRVLRQPVGLEPARQHGRPVAIPHAGVFAVPLVRQRLAGFGVQVPLRREHETGPGTGCEVPGPVQFVGPGEGDRVLASLDRRKPVDAILGESANREDLLLVVDRLLALLLAVLVAELAVLQPLNLHPRRVQRDQLIDRSRLPGHDLAVGHVVETGMQHQLASPLKRGLPPVRL